MRRAAQSNEPAYVWYEAEFFRETIPSELLYGAAQHHQLAGWASGMIRAQGARGFNSRNGPCCLRVSGSNGIVSLGQLGSPEWCRLQCCTGAQSPQTSCDAHGQIRRVGRRRPHTGHGATQPDPCPPMPCSSPIP